MIIFPLVFGKHHIRPRPHPRTQKISMPSGENDNSQAAECHRQSFPIIDGFNLPTMTDILITGIGHYLPPKQVANEDLPVDYPVDGGGIEKRTGIRTRHYIEGRVYTSDIATLAARAALKHAGLAAEQLDCIITATLSPDYCFPGIGVYIQDKLGCAHIPAYDVRNQCTGFLYALNIARAFVKGGLHQNILVVGAEVQSRALGKTEMHSHITPLFGDGAAAVIVSSTAHTNSFVASVDDVELYADGSGADKLRQRVWDISLDSFMDWQQVCESEQEMWFAEMDGQFIFRRAVKEMTKATRNTLKKHNMTIEDVDLIICHQANLNINKTVTSILEVPPEKMPNNIDRVGNTTAASIPLLLSESLADGKVHPGHKILLVTFGSGLTWGTSLLTVQHAAAN